MAALIGAALLQQRIGEPQIQAQAWVRRLSGSPITFLLTSLQFRSFALFAFCTYEKEHFVSFFRCIISKSVRPTHKAHLG